MSEKNDQELYHKLSYYTLEHPSPTFIHQHAVDAFTAQHADEKTKPIAITFALIGLYLFVEKQFSGKQVQKMHVLLAKKRKQWPTFALPQHRGVVTITDVLKARPGEPRDDMIGAWCVSTWQAYKASHQQVRELVAAEMPNL